MSDHKAVLGSAAWVQQTHGWMTAAERRSLVGPLARTHLSNAVGRAAHGRAAASRAQRLHSGVPIGGARDGVDPCGAEGG